MAINQSANTKEMVGKWGPVAGGVIALLGALIALVSFILQWVSFMGTGVTGIDMLSQISTFSQGSTSVLLYTVFCVPVLGLVLILAGIATIPLAILKNMKDLYRIIVGAVIIVISLCGCCSPVSFALGLNSSLGAASSSAPSITSLLGAGFWVSLVGFGLTLLGGIVATVTAVMAKQKSI